MQARFSFFDEFGLDFSFGSADDGASVVRALFLKFLGRVRDPHVTAFTEPEMGASHLTPHFTSGRFRRRLARIHPRVLGAFFARFSEAAMERHVQAVRKADLQTLHDEGWTLHWVDFRVLRRWIRYAAKTGRFRVDAEALLSFVHHVIRHHDRPLSLRDAPTDRALRFVLLRTDSRGELCGRLLVYLPDGYWHVASPAEPPTCAHPPGWYMHDFSWLDRGRLEAMLPVTRVRRVSDVVVRLLRRYPRTEPPRPSVELPPIVSQLFGVYASDLLQIAFDATAARAGQGMRGVTNPPQ